MNEPSSLGEFAEHVAKILQRNNHPATIIESMRTVDSDAMAAPVILTTIAARPLAIVVIADDQHKRSVDRHPVNHELTQIGYAVWNVQANYETLAENLMKISTTLYDGLIQQLLKRRKR